MRSTLLRLLVTLLAVGVIGAVHATQMAASADAVVVAHGQKPPPTPPPPR